MRSEGIKIYDLTPFTLLDYPDTPAAILWLAGCNMRCPYCHNPEIVFGKNERSFDEVLLFLQKRSKVLEGVVISGGEPTLHPDIVTICKRIKELGYKIKLDTNGSRPNVVATLLERKLIDYVALDFKAAEHRYKEVTGKDFFKRNLETLLLLNSSEIAFEVRTTVHTDLLCEDDIATLVELLRSIGYEKKYILQNYRQPERSLGELETPRRAFDLTKVASYNNIETRNF